MIIFTCLLTPTFAWWDKFSESTIFNTDGVTLDDMPLLVEKDSQFFNAFTEAHRINVLLTGTNQELADVIMLCSYDLDTDNIALISVPRDTYFPRQGHPSADKKKLNASYKDDGVLGLATSVSQILQGIPINFYMKIDYDGIRNIVDAMGGVPVTVTLEGGLHYSDPYDTPPLEINIDEGYQVLDGDHAVQYLRFRKGYPDGDIGRIRAQQEFMKSAFKQALGLNLIKVVNTVLDNVDSDIKVKTCVSLAKGAKGLSSDKLTTYTVPGHADYGEGGLSFWYADEEGIREMLTEIYSMPAVETPAENGDAA